MIVMMVDRILRCLEGYSISCLLAVLYYLFVQITTEEARALGRFKTTFKEVDASVQQKRQRHDSASSVESLPETSDVKPRKEDLGPPRHKKRHDSDADNSPPRHKRHDSGADNSPPRRKRHDSDDMSPPRRRTSETKHAVNGTRHQHDSNDKSSPRRRRHHERDSSPPRRRRHDSDDKSPPRRHRRDSDASPPRRRRRESEHSPERKHGKLSLTLLVYDMPLRRYKARAEATS